MEESLLAFRYHVNDFGFGVLNFYLHVQLLLGSYVYFANPEANWGSASQAQTILTAMNATQVGALNLSFPNNFKSLLPWLDWLRRDKQLYSGNHGYT